MNGTICQICKQPVRNYMCIECIGTGIKDWLPFMHIRGFMKFHRLFSEQFTYDYAVFKGRNSCLKCKKDMQHPVCPYCYINEVFLWIKERDVTLAALFINVFRFDFEGSGHREFHDLEEFEPLTGEEERNMDEGICEECECYSAELREQDGKWLCELCEEE